MASTSASMNVLIPGDVLCHILEQLVGDIATLISISLASKAWNALSIPYLLRNFDLASHKHGQLIPFLGTMEFLEMDHSRFLTRQRSFLRLMTEKPELAKHVHSFSWTLIWQVEYEEQPNDIVRETWNVFSRLENVTALDLAQYIGVEVCTEPLVRQNPLKLFPRVTSLRLEGWMHRGLAKAVVSSIDPRKLRVLKLDGLNDEGMLPDGHPMIVQIEERYARDNARIEDLSPFDDAMVRRQDQRTACSFQGPMWYPLRLLAGCPLDSLTVLDIQLSPLHSTDKRNYLTMFQATANALQAARKSLQTVRIAFGESPQHYKPLDARCGNARIGWDRYQRECVAMASVFLLYVMPVLCDEEFPRLTKLDFEGFRIIDDFGGQLENVDREIGISELQYGLPLFGVSVLENGCLSILETGCVDFRWSEGRGISDYHPDLESLDQYIDIFRSS